MISESDETMLPQETSPMKQEMSVLGIDIAKRVFHAVGMDERGKIVFRKRLSRHDLIPLLAKLPVWSKNSHSSWVGSRRVALWVRFLNPPV